MITLKHKLPSGEQYTAQFDSEGGMNLISFKKEKCEAIDQNTRDLFEDRKAGLGALIGPHFHLRSDDQIPPIPDEKLFPHIARELSRGRKDVFSHGIARYVPWNVTHDESSLSAKLSSIDAYQGVLISNLEGKNFVMKYNASLSDHGLSIELVVKSDEGCIVGMHPYFATNSMTSLVTGYIEKECIIDNQTVAVPKDWLHSEHHLKLGLNQDLDVTFHPLHNPFQFTLHNDEYTLLLGVEKLGPEASLQVYRPKEASYVCIEPLSAFNPRGDLPIEGHLKIQLQIL